MRNWQQRGLLAYGLWPFSCLFGMIAALRRLFYRGGIFHSTRLPVPVVIVGNLFVGGTGKTPLTIWLVEALREAGYVPGVVLRGYGARVSMPVRVEPASDPQQVGDEAVLIACRTHAPVMVSSDRVAAAQALLQAYPDISLIISDDGLQHYALVRDIEIILFDARYAGNGFLLPAGPLRESVSRRRDFTVINAASLPENCPPDTLKMQLQAHWIENLTQPVLRVPLDLIVERANRQRQRIVAAAGIGNPARFFVMLRAAGLIINELSLPDHYDFLNNPFVDIEADMILVTEKDAVKCRRSTQLKNDDRIWVVPVEALIDSVLIEKMVEKLRESSST